MFQDDRLAKTQTTEIISDANISLPVLYAALS